MAAPSFERAVAHVLKSEGGYVDNPKDPGGATNRGITRETLARARGRAVTKTDVKNLTEAEAKDIYRRFYWNKVRCDALPGGLDLTVFDYAVNSGETRAVKALQGVLGVPVDGVIGPKTIAAATRADCEKAIRDLCRARLEFLSKLPTYPVFGKGWRVRVLSVQTEALAMAGTPVPPPPDIEPVEPKKDGWLVSLLKRIFA